jgi:hypothetical protein
MLAGERELLMRFVSSGVDEVLLLFDYESCQLDHPELLQADRPRLSTNLLQSDLRRPSCPICAFGKAMIAIRPAEWIGGKHSLPVNDRLVALTCRVTLSGKACSTSSEILRGDLSILLRSLRALRHSSESFEGRIIGWDSSHQHQVF